MLSRLLSLRHEIRPEAEHMFIMKKKNFAKHYIQLLLDWYNQ